jgi:uncharacterized YigZ family protein
MDDRFLTIRDEATVEIKIKGSRFIGESFLAATAGHATERLTVVRKREYAATHHCYAWRVGVGNESTFKYSDDGEPNGTAGRPIYDIITGNDLTNTLLVVTRYFGGTKLGTGGLTHAYSDCARAAIEQSGTKEHFILNRYRIELEFSYYDRWKILVNRMGIIEREAIFEDQVRIVAEIRRSRGDELVRAVIELTAGKGKIEALTIA